MEEKNEQNEISDCEIIYENREIKKKKKFDWKIKKREEIFLVMDDSILNLDKDNKVETLNQVYEIEKIYEKEEVKPDKILKSKINELYVDFLKCSTENEFLDFIKVNFLGKKEDEDKDENEDEDKDENEDEDEDEDENEDEDEDKDKDEDEDENLEDGLIYKKPYVNKMVIQSLQYAVEKINEVEKIYEVKRERKKIEFMKEDIEEWLNIKYDDLEVDNIDNEFEDEEEEESNTEIDENVILTENKDNKRLFKFYEIIKKIKNRCEHGINKKKCKRCNKSKYCIHENHKYYCQKCEGKGLCVFCKDTRANKKYEKHCLRCYVNLFPEKAVSKNYLTKERRVIDFIKGKFPDFDWYQSKRVFDGCSKRRPDLLLDLGYQLIIIEVDENQHRRYGDSCENRRIMELSLDVGHRPIIFIRFNPDGYINSFGKKIESCWGIHGISGISIVKSSHNKEWSQRLEILEKKIRFWIDEKNKSTKIVHVIHLFFDGYI